VLTAGERQRLIAKGLDPDFPATYTLAFETKYGRKPTAEELKAACDAYAGKPIAKGLTVAGVKPVRSGHGVIEFDMDEELQPSAVHIKRAEGATETNMKVMPDKIIVKSKRELFELVSKGVKPGVKVFMPQAGDLFDDKAEDVIEVDVSAVERLIAEMAGRSDDATREPMYRPAAFTSGDALGREVVPAPKPQPTYAYDEITQDAFTRVGPFFVGAPVDPHIAAPAEFKPSEPEDRHDADHAKTSVFKRVGGTGRHDVPRGTFANLVDQSNSGIVSPREIREQGV
jgi:hypothetical protein